MGWSATQKKVLSGYSHNKTNLSDTSELYFDPNSVYKGYRWEWGTRLISDTVLYAQVLPIPTYDIPADLNGQRDQNNLFVLHHTDHIVANDSILYHDSMQSGIDVDLWPFCYYNYAGHDRNGKNGSDYLATAEDWVEEDGWTFIGYRYLDEMIYYYDEMGSLIRTAPYGDRLIIISDNYLSVKDERLPAGTEIRYFGVLTDVYQRELVTEEIWTTVEE